MTDAIEGLVERNIADKLRFWASYPGHWLTGEEIHASYVPIERELLLEAAAQLTRLSGEVERWKKISNQIARTANDDLIARCEAQSQLATCREALEAIPLEKTSQHSPENYCVGCGERARFGGVIMHRPGCWTPAVRKALATIKDDNDNAKDMW